MELGWQLAPPTRGHPERRNVIDHSGQQCPVGRVGRGDRDRQGQPGGIGQQVQLGPGLPRSTGLGPTWSPHGGPARPWCPHHPSGATRRLESRAAGGMRHGPTATPYRQNTSATSTSAWRRGSGSCRRNDRFSTPSLLATGRHEPGCGPPGERPGGSIDHCLFPSLARSRAHRRDRLASGQLHLSSAGPRPARFAKDRRRGDQRCLAADACPVHPALVDDQS